MRRLALRVGNRRFHLTRRPGRDPAQRDRDRPDRARRAARARHDSATGGARHRHGRRARPHPLARQGRRVRPTRSRRASASPRATRRSRSACATGRSRRAVGRTIDERRRCTLIDDDARRRPDQPLVVHVAVVKLHPKVNADDIRARNTTIVTIDRANFTLRLFKHLKIARRYPIAVGRAGLETPTGLYHVQDKQINPSWHVPNAAWAGDLAGHDIPPGPSDPLVARWMGLASGVGIHGTNEPWTVGLGGVARVHPDARRRT